MDRALLRSFELDAISYNVYSFLLAVPHGLESSSHVNNALQILRIFFGDPYVFFTVAFILIIIIVSSLSASVHMQFSGLPFILY